MEYRLREVDSAIFSIVKQGCLALEELGLDITAVEIPLVEREMDFGGTADVLFEPQGVLDFKTRTSLNTYPTDAMQLAAYGAMAYGSEFVTCGGRAISVILSTNEEKYKIKEWTPLEIWRAWEAFKGIREFWKWDSNYYAD